MLPAGMPDAGCGDNRGSRHEPSMWDLGQSEFSGPTRSTADPAPSRDVATGRAVGARPADPVIRQRAVPGSRRPSRHADTSRTSFGASRLRARPLRRCANTLFLFLRCLPNRVGNLVKPSNGGVHRPQNAVGRTRHNHSDLGEDTPPDRGAIAFDQTTPCSSADVTDRDQSGITLV
jgi:hypothetical protein